jgi:hypothetical protein
MIAFVSAQNLTVARRGVDEKGANKCFTIELRYGDAEDGSG